MKMKSPIRIEEDEYGIEAVVYHPEDLELGKMYDFIWNGKMWGLKKTEKGVVEFYTFHESLSSKLRRFIKRQKLPI